MQNLAHRRLIGQRLGVLGNVPIFKKFIQSISE
jgi:hypothetical protein